MPTSDSINAVSLSSQINMYSLRARLSLVNAYQTAIFSAVNICGSKRARITFDKIFLGVPAKLNARPITCSYSVLRL